MNFAEVLVAALLLAGASSGSLQIWTAAMAASRGAEQGLEQLVELDGALLGAEQHLQQARPAATGADCPQAMAVMAAALAQAPLPAGLARQVDPQAGGLWLRLQAQGLPQRQRWLDAAALGYCGSAPTPEAGADGVPE